jgi:hypothetical protein
VKPHESFDHTGLERGSKILHPRAKTIARHFDFQDHQISQDYSLATAQARFLMALVAASLTRSFLNQQTPTVNVLRSPQALTLLKAVFRPLGQVRPVELTSKRLEPDMPLLQALLSQIPPTQAQEHFRYDMRAGVLYIRCRLLREVTRKPLYEELLAKNPSVRLHGDHYIACPAAWFLDLLAKFYGRTITLPHQSTDPTQPAEAQSAPIVLTAGT